MKNWVKKNHKEIFLYITIVYILVFTAVFGIKEDIKAMSVLIGAGIVVLFFQSIDKFESFKGGGIEAKLQKAVNEANATINQLRELAKSISEPTLQLLTMHNRYTQYIPLTEKLGIKKRITNSLKEIGIEEKELSEVTLFFDTIYLSDHIKKIESCLINKESSKINKDTIENSFEPFISIPDNMNEYNPKVDEIIDVIKKLGYEKNDCLEELDDLEFYKKHNEFRRIEQWQ